MSVRKPVVAGQFYPVDKEELIASIEESFKHKFGPGKLPGKRGSNNVLGAVSPHAGYVFSGAGAAHVFKAIGEAAFPDTYVILGVNHSGPRTCASSEDWETPLGVVKCDSELVKALGEKGVPVDDRSHHNEHSIEVQLPFLQYVSKDRIDDLRAVCVMIADDDYEKWGKVITDAVSELGRKVVVVCSSDFTHYGHNYGYVPFESDVAENMKKLDAGAIDLILKKDSAGFIGYVEKTGATICGKHGIAVLCWLMKAAGSGAGELLKYYTSGDVMGDHSNAVGYGAVVFKKKIR
ncbi:AmmeMemoRadiSam system protein B [Candidatus Woesearchaeota archaeon]|nr:AmmeMemoRadiSam system protein B [Candidatus Woesearchaeota archaeon]